MIGYVDTLLYQPSGQHTIPTQEYSGFSISNHHGRSPTKRRRWARHTCHRCNGRVTAKCKQHNLQTSKQYKWITTSATSSQVLTKGNKAAQTTPQLKGPAFQEKMGKTRAVAMVYMAMIQKMALDTMPLQKQAQLQQLILHYMAIKADQSHRWRHQHQKNHQITFYLTLLSPSNRGQGQHSPCQKWPRKLQHQIDTKMQKRPLSSIISKGWHGCQPCHDAAG